MNEYTSKYATNQFEKFFSLGKNDLITEALFTGDNSLPTVNRINSNNLKGYAQRYYCFKSHITRYFKHIIKYKDYTLELITNYNVKYPSPYYALYDFQNCFSVTVNSYKVYTVTTSPIALRGYIVINGEINPFIADFNDTYSDYTIEGGI